MQTIRWLLFGFTIFLYSACSDCSCIDQDISLNFINFDSTEVDTIIVKQYEKAAAFAKQIDSTFLKEGDGYRMKRKNDTIFFPALRGDFLLNSRFDYIITLPELSREFMVTEMNQEQIRSSCSGKVQCANPFISAKIDNQILYSAENRHEIFFKK